MSSTESTDQITAGSRRTHFVLFALGFRPFFLGAALFAVLLMAQWLFTFVGQRDFVDYYGTVGWHSHEMIFGYTMAVIAGFLLTAARNWTNMATASGDSLAALFALWLAARVMPFLTDVVPGWLTAVVDLAFIPVLTVALAVPLLRAGQRRNLIFLPLLAALAVANFLIHSELTGFTVGTARAGTFLGLNLIVLLIVIMGGRVIPFFTERALAGMVPKRWRAVEWLSIGSALAYAGMEFLLPHSMTVATVAALAGASNAVRMFGWYSHRFWSVPLLWVLHLGYAWIVAGFFLRALAALGFIPPQFTVHALTVGGIGVLTLGMMARVSLGHTGRPLKVSRGIALAFLLINFAAVFRGILPIPFPEYLAHLVLISGGLWILSFGIFLAIYAPILTQPRIDGRPG